MKITGAAAAGVVLAAALAWQLAKEPPFRRNPLIEVMRLVRIAATYEASYRDCADARYERRADARGFALAFAGRGAHRFPAMNDADAVTFARAALPACRLDMLMRLRRFGFTRAQQRERIPVDLSAR